MIHNNKNIFYEKDFSSNQTVDISITKFKCAFFFFSPLLNQPNKNPLEYSLLTNNPGKAGPHQWV